jgi:hypothetical protein
MTTSCKKEPKLDEIAERILKHLRRFEADPKINKMHPEWRTSHYYMVNCFRSGARIGVKYIAYQGVLKLTREEAVEYLRLLDEGKIGTHFQVLSGFRKQKAFEKAKKG